jgi:iron(III) transport system permease protein
VSARLLLGGAVALLLFAVGWPLLALVASSAGHLDEAAAALVAPPNVRALVNTLILAVGVTAITLVVGVPLGILLGRTDLPGTATWRALATTPYVVPPYITAIAWITLLNPTTGLLNAPLVALGLPPLDIYGLGGMIFVMSLSSAPLVLLATADALGRADASLEEQARMAGAGPWQALWRVTLPLAAPGILEGAGFVLATTTAAFGVPYLLASGTPRPDPVLTTRIYQALDLAPATGRPVAVALSAALLVVGVGLPLALRAARGRGRFTTVSGKATRQAALALGRARPVAIAALATYVGIAVVLPIGTIALTSVLGNVGRGITPENLTFSHYAAVLWGRADTIAALTRSLVLAAVAATAATALGALIAWLVQRTTAPGRGLVAALARLPYAIPGTVLALGFLLGFSQELRVIVLERVTIGVALADTPWLLGLAYTARFLTFPTGRVDAGLRATDRSLDEAARMSGAGFATTLWRVGLPLLRPELAAGWFLVFLPAFSEVTLSILLRGPGTQVVGTLLFDLQTYGDPPAAAVLAVVVTFIVLGGNAALRLATRGRLGL